MKKVVAVAEEARPKVAVAVTPGAALVAYDRWREQVGVTASTGWRWRRNGWLNTTNICGRLYLTADAIAEFTRRATAGEFSQVHKVPLRAKEVA